MNKISLAQNISERLIISTNDAKKIVELFVSSFKYGLKKEKRIEIRGFGIFKVVTKKSSIRRNPKTGEQVNVPSKNVVVFKPGEELAEIVNT